MTQTAGQDRNQQAIEYLRLLRSLNVELEGAMLAIASNQLVDLEESVAEQENLSVRLGVICGNLTARHGGTAGIAGKTLDKQLVLDKQLAEEISVASHALQQTNRIYAQVLQRSRHSAVLMATLLDSCTGHFHEAAGSGSRGKTWSCRM